MSSLKLSPYFLCLKIQILSYTRYSNYASGIISETKTYFTLFVFDIQQKTFTIIAIQVQLSDDFIIIKNIQ